MNSQRDYSEGVKAALHVLSGGGCYRPNCGEPAIRLIDGIPQKNLQIAHIHALEDNGPRADRAMPKPLRNHFSNLILLCTPCHKLVDDHPDTYTASILKKWKADREGKPLSSLAGLRDLDIRGMESLLDKAMSQLRQDMSKFTREFPELAQLLREMAEAPPPIDVDTVELLHSSALMLQNLPDDAPLLKRAAEELSELPDKIFLLDQTVQQIEDSTIYRLSEQIQTLSELIDKLTHTANNASLDNKPAPINRPPERRQIPPVRTNRHPATVRPSQIPVNFWKAMAIGWSGWPIAALLAYLISQGKM